MAKQYAGEELTVSDVLMEELRQADAEIAKKLTGLWRSADILDERLREAWPAGEVLDFRLADTIMGECWRLRRWPFRVLALQSGQGLSIWWRARPQRRGMVWVIIQPEILFVYGAEGAFGKRLATRHSSVTSGRVRGCVQQAIRWLREVERASN